MHVIFQFTIKETDHKFKHTYQEKHTLLVWVRNDLTGYEMTQQSAYETTGNPSIYSSFFTHLPFFR